MFNRRILVSVLFIVSLMFGGLVAAQDETPTIAEIVVASAEGETPEFSTLLTAVTLADEGVLAALSNPDAELTVFAPTDAAFAALAEALGEETFNAVLEDQEMLTEILLYHVIAGAVFSGDVLGGLEANEGMFSVPTLQGQYITVTQTEEGVFVDDAALVLDMLDIEAANGVIHVIDAVILPEFRTIAEIVADFTAMEEGAEFSTLLTAVTLADPAVLEALSDPTAELTVFAPTDAAFAALAEALGEEAFNDVLQDTETLTNILLYHVVPSVVYFDTAATLLMENMGEISVDTALEGAAFTLSVSDEGGVFVDNAEIIIVDVEAANGVIHVIDAVILPPME